MKERLASDMRCVYRLMCIHPRSTLACVQIPAPTSNSRNTVVCPRFSLQQLSSSPCYAGTVIAKALMFGIYKTSY
jgi:hypothetical protein